MNAFVEEDVGNIIALEHVNLQVPDQSLAILFYVVGLGLTRDPYLNVGVRNMWVNAGDEQFHLPTRPAQTIDGHIGLVVPDLEALRLRLGSVEAPLQGTRFGWSAAEDHVAVTCPWGNRFRCHAPGPRFGDISLGIPYVEFRVKTGAAKAILDFYERVLEAPVSLRDEAGGVVGEVEVGQRQRLRFVETSEPTLPYDGHHVAVYVGNFSRPHSWLKKRGLITEDARDHQFRFSQIVNPDSGETVFSLEHEVRSLRHPMFSRPFINRNPEQSQRAYKRGRDALGPG